MPCNHLRNHVSATPPQGAYWLFTSQETNGAYSALLSLTASLGASGSLSLKSPLDMTARQTKSEGVILGSNTAVVGDNVNAALG
jgi:hypothetical protein